jgi:hypothetical protein
MPPKKAKKGKRRPQRRMMTITPLPRLPTGFNRDIPPMGGPGGFSNLLSNLARQPPAQPIQTPDQFNIIQQQRKQAEVIAEVVEEQKVARKERSDKGIKRGSYLSRMPVGKQVPINKAASIKQESVTPSQAEQAMTGIMESPASNIRKVGRPPGSKNKLKPPSVPPPEFGSPPQVGTGPLFADGTPVNQQGLFLGTESQLRSAPPDFSGSLVGPDPI